MALSRKEFDDRLAERNLTPEQADYLRREYYKDAVKPALKSVPSATRKQVITDWGIVAPPKQQSARTRDHLVESFKENALPHYGDIAKGAVRTLIDEGPEAIARRASGQVADAAYDVVAKPLGLPSAAQTDKAMGRTPNRRILPYVPPEQRSAGENIGGFVGGFASPANLAMPLSVFKAAPVTSAGINLLPKAAPSMTQQVLKGALGAGTTNAAIGGSMSIASQLLDGQELDPTRTLADTAFGFAGGAVLGAPAGAMNILAARDAARRGGAAAMADAAARAAAAPKVQLPAPRPVLALPPARSGPILPSDGTVIPAPRGPLQMTPGTPVERQVAAAVSDWVDNDVRGMRANVAPVDAPAPRAPEPSGPVIEMPPVGGRAAEAQPLTDDGWGDYAAKMREQQAAQMRALQDLEGDAPTGQPRNLAALLTEEDGSFDPEALREAVENLTRKIWAKASTRPELANKHPDDMVLQLRAEGDPDVGLLDLMNQKLRAGRMAIQGGPEDQPRTYNTGRAGMKGDTFTRGEATPEGIAARREAEAQRAAAKAQADAEADAPFIDPSGVQVKAPSGATLEGVNQTPAPKYGIAGKTLRRLASEESGQASMPNLDDVRAAGNAAIEAGISAAEIVARPMRALDALIERGIAATRAGDVVRPVAGVVRRGKDMAKDRLRTGITDGRLEAADDLGRFFVSSKAPTQYQDLKDAIRSQTIRQMQGLTDEAARLEQAGVDQEALHNIVTDRNLASPDADAVRNLTNRVSSDLLDVGSLTPQQQAKWAGEYLPRSYADKDNAIAGLVRKARRAVTLSGSKRRGQVKELSPEALAVRQKPWAEVGTSADGRVVLEDATTGQTILVARRNVGDFTAEWSNVGTAKGGKVKAWRDWTPTEREAMGELKNVSHALRKIAATAMGDLNNGRLLKAVSENPEWAVPDSPGLTPPEGWVLIDNAVVKSNGVRKWGRLAGHWVEPSIAADLASATNNDAIGQVVKILRTYTGINQFKKLKVVYNPASHGNQLMQNMITLEAAGGSVSDVPRAARLLRTADDPTIAQFRDLGLYGDDYLSTEGMAGAGSSDYLDWGAAAGIPRVAAGVDEAASSLYQFSDNMTRTAYVLGKVDEGVPVEQAVREARERFYNGNTVNSGFARLGSASLLPFVKPALYTLDRLPELIEANPVKAVKLLAYWMAFDQGFKALSGHSGDEEGRQALLPDYQKGTAKTIPLPIRDTRGQQLLFDYQRMNPIGSTFGVNDRTGFGPVPEAFVPTGGPLGGLAQAIANRDLFRDKPLRTNTTNDTAAFLLGHFTPGFTGNGQRLMRAITGTPEADGETQYDVPTALAGMVGLKVQPFLPEKGYDQNMRKFEIEANDLRAQSNRIARSLESRHISQEEHDRAQAEIEARFEELNARYEAWDTQAQRGLRAFGGQP